MFNIPANIVAAVAAGFAAENIEAANQRQIQQANRAENAERRNQLNPFIFLTDKSFQDKFRLPKDLAEWLCEQISSLLSDEGPISNIPKNIQILTTLRFYASGSFQTCIGDMKYSCLSQPMVSRIIANVTTAITTLADDFIMFPQTREEFEEISEGFEAEIGFPGVAGCIDCTHIAVHAPVMEPWIYKNYKNFYSINIQVTCNHKMRITSFEAYPGRTHDARIWRQSPIKEAMERLNNEFEETFRKIFYVHT